MIPVQQSLLHDKEKGIVGDCFRAVIASLFHLSIEDVPHFAALPNGEWWESVQEWLSHRGCKLVHCSYEWDDTMPQDEYFIVNGMSPRSVLHSVIYFNGEMVHDPHPSNMGVDTIESFYTIEYRR